MKRLTTLACAGVLLAGATLSANEAAAHGSRHAVHERHYHAPRVVYRRHVAPPRWLRRHRDFLHWYDLRGYRYAPSIGWHGLYRSYRRDRNWHRHDEVRHARCDHHRRGRYHGRRYRDDD